MKKVVCLEEHKSCDMWNYSKSAQSTGHFNILVLYTCRTQRLLFLISAVSVLKGTNPKYRICVNGLALCISLRKYINMFVCSSTYIPFCLSASIDGRLTPYLNLL